MSFIKEEFKMKSILVSSVKGYSGKSAVIIALGRILREKDDFVLDRLLVAKELLGDWLKYVLFNQLAGYKKVYVRGVAERFLERNGMELLGTLPYDPLLAGLYMILGKARIRGDAKIRGLKELVKRVLDLGRLWGH